MNTFNPDFDNFLSHLAKNIEVQPSERQKAINEYDKLTSWLRRDNTDRFKADSDVYPQGSIRLGTLIRPVDPSDDFDIDLVYRRDVAKESYSQIDLFESAGDQLSRYIKFLRSSEHSFPQLKRNRRCWTLVYDSGFHLDVLPAIPEATDSRVSSEATDPILITDRLLQQWQHSNPKGFSSWFNSQQTQRLEEHRKLAAKEAQTSVESIPPSHVATPLRVAVKLLKRHRDIRYPGDQDDKPISIIITTLAAHAYNNEATVDEAISGLVARMENHIKVRNGIVWVANPTNQNENFADKWVQVPRRESVFKEWLNKLNRDLQNARNQKGMHKVAEVLSEGFGAPSVTETLDSLGRTAKGLRDAGGLTIATATGNLGTSGNVTVKKHTNFGG